MIFKIMPESNLIVIEVSKSSSKLKTHLKELQKGSCGDFIEWYVFIKNEKNQIANPGHLLRLTEKLNSPE